MSRIETRQQIVRIERLENIYQFYKNFQPIISCEGTLNEYFEKFLSINNLEYNSISNIFNDLNLNDSLKKMMNEGLKTGVLNSSAINQYDSIRNYLQIQFPGTPNDKEISKAAALVTLAQSAISVQTINIQAMAGNILYAHEPGDVILKSLNDLQVEHEKMFLTKTSAAVAAASCKAGFDNVRIQENGDQFWVIAQSKEGKILKSEIQNSDGNNIRIESETINVLDGSCHAALEKFSLALREFGVIFAEKDVIVKGTECNVQIPQKSCTPGLIKENESNSTRLKKVQKKLIKNKF